MELNRYDHDYHPEDGCLMAMRSDGDYILYSDHAKEIATKDARIAALEAQCERMAKCIEAAGKLRLYRPASHPSDLRNGALRDEWKQLCAAFDEYRAAVEEGSR